MLTLAYDKGNEEMKPRANPAGLVAGTTEREIMATQYVTRKGRVITTRAELVEYRDHLAARLKFACENSRQGRTHGAAIFGSREICDLRNDLNDVEEWMERPS